MRILVYGAGVIGSIFAGRLFSSGHNVTILARNDRFHEIKNNGLKLRDIKKGKVENYHVDVIDNLHTDDTYDYVLVAMQFQHIENILPTLSENKSKNIIFFVNNPSGYDKWKQCLGNRLMIGFPACGGEIINNITEYYISKGITKGVQTTTFGEIDGSYTNRLRLIVIAFSNSGIPSTTSKCIDSWQKTHVAMVVPVANAIYKNGGNIKLLASNTSDLKLMIRAIREGLNSIKELGYAVEPINLNFYYMPLGFLTLIYKIAFKTDIADLSMARHANNAKTETYELQIAFETLIKDTKNYKEEIYKLNRFNVIRQQKNQRILN